MSMKEILLATTNTVAGRETAEVVGLVQGCTVQSKHIGQDILASLTTIVGGEIAAYTEMLEDARRIAVERMKKEARAQGANAIVGVRFSSASIMQNAAEILVYGTAVKLL